MRDKLSLHEIGKHTGLSRNTIHTRIRELHEAGTAVARAHSSAAVQLVALYKALGGGWDMSSTINAPKGAVGPAPVASHPDMPSGTSSRSAAQSR